MDFAITINKSFGLELGQSYIGFDGRCQPMCSKYFCRTLCFTNINVTIRARNLINTRRELQEDDRKRILRFQVLYENGFNIVFADVWNSNPEDISLK